MPSGPSPCHQLVKSTVVLSVHFHRPSYSRQHYRHSGAETNGSVHVKRCPPSFANLAVVGQADPTCTIVIVTDSWGATLAAVVRCGGTNLFAWGRDGLSSDPPVGQLHWGVPKSEGNGRAGSISLGDMNAAPRQPLTARQVCGCWPGGTRAGDSQPRPRPMSPGYLVVYRASAHRWLSAAAADGGHHCWACVHTR